MSDLITSPAADAMATTPVWRDGVCSAHISNIGGTTLVTIAGSVDAASIDDFDGHLSAACATGARRVVVDMTDVDFLGAGGLASLRDAAQSVIDAGGAIAVTGPRAVSRPMQRTGLTGIVAVYDWLPTAFEAVGGRFRVL
ncbi:STAS domain-containing protein [Gordonia araii]|nr:STAS domain-containing protein [Gordonia araii]